MIDEVIKKIEKQYNGIDRRENPNLRLDLVIQLGGLIKIKQRAQELDVTFKTEKQVYKALVEEINGDKYLDAYLLNLKKHS